MFLHTIVLLFGFWVGFFVRFFFVSVFFVVLVVVVVVVVMVVVCLFVCLFVVFFPQHSLSRTQIVLRYYLEQIIKLNERTEMEKH